MPRSRRGGRKRQIKRLKWRLIEAGTFDPRVFDRPPPPEASPRRHGSPGPFELRPPQPPSYPQLIPPAPPCRVTPPPIPAPFKRPPPRLPPETDTAPIRAPTRPVKVDRQVRPPPRQKPRITSNEVFVGSLPKLILSAKATSQSTETY
ncbi:anther-specific proline-rich protein APG-like [Monomorium pharaonis]|uniref:anther-specific proline-rich protein APG-like n=1 Tax=Monomorium pharaonis TaxID=307658 RepID=UPI001747C82E|nr:anther-specific proline-rich protein APG-like [Monomorium pharaonis]